MFYLFYSIIADFWGNVKSKPIKKLKLFFLCIFTYEPTVYQYKLLVFPFRYISVLAFCNHMMYFPQVDLKHISSLFSYHSLSKQHSVQITATEHFYYQALTILSSELIHEGLYVLSK